MISDRSELSKIEAKEIELRCKHCNKSIKYHVNEIYAVQRLFPLILALMVFVFGTIIEFVLLWDYFFRINFFYNLLSLISVLLVPFWIYNIINNEENKKVRNFNSYKV